MKRSGSKTDEANPSAAQLQTLEQQYTNGNYSIVLEACEKLLALFPHSPVVYNALGMTLIAALKPREALNAFDKAIKLAPNNADVYLNKGLALYNLDQSSNALNAYNRAIQLDPKCVKAYNNRGTVLHESGQINEAKKSYYRAIAINPSYTIAFRNLSQLKTFNANDPQINLMEELLSQKNLSGSDYSNLHFSLAKAYEDINEYDKSFKHLNAGNTLRKKELNYDIRLEIDLGTKIKRIFSKFKTDTPVLSKFDKDLIRPVFIVGMMRSGTSLVEQILASHSEVFGAGERYAVDQLMSSTPWKQLDTRHDSKAAFDDFTRQFRKGYLKELRRLNRTEKVITDKMPANFRWLGFILSAFPDAKIINLNRDPIATCWSCYKHYFTSDAVGYAYDFDDLAQYYKHYIDLMSFWRERFPGSIYDINYEYLTENQQQETRQLIEFCGLKMEQQCLQFHRSTATVKTASTTQVRRKMYQGSSEAWKKYEKHLQPLLDAL